MLWEEAVEPEAALRTRFGFDGFASAVHWISSALKDVWAIEVVDCGRLVISDHNAIVWVDSSHGPLVVKWSSAWDRFASLAASARLLRRLDRRGLPVAAPIAAEDGQVRVVRDSPLGTLSVAALPEVAGAWLDVEDDAAVRAAGASLAELHGALRGYADDGLPSVTEVEALNGQIERWLATGDRRWAPSASARLKGLVTDLPPLDDGMQLVHNDFRAANILTRESKVVGVLDFDEMALDHRVNDLARASVYLSTRFTDWRPTPDSVRRELRAGYESVRPLEPAEDRWFDALLLWHAIRAIPEESDPAGWAEAL
ncbi:phosphotransferase enzyme family protein [Microlunatus panaciterrae]|uniref:phosphotransferase enzyme family protein n=1 Tax=Microlunatus panaciterrae TaxID=400768 RepID=UPI001958FCE5|nr:phosphotransferase [Microlunatus panaciterrae]